MQNSNIAEFTIDEMVELTEKCLGVFGLAGDELHLVRDVLMYAELRGKSQGFSKLIERTVAPAPGAQEMIITNRSDVTAHIRCRGQVGMVVLDKAREIAESMAKQHGVGVVGTSHTASSTGSIGFYAERLARNGYVGIVMAGSPGSMAVAGGTEAVMGTNPVAIAIPTQDEPLVLDMATASVTWFELINAARTGTAIAADLAFDADGRATTNASDAMAGAIRPFGGYKGSGLGLMFELLTGPLVGAAIVGDDEDNRGNLVIALSASMFVDEDEFRQRTSRLLERIRQGQRQDEGEPDKARQITLPGDNGRARAEDRLRRGTLDVDVGIVEQLRQISGDQET